MKVKRVVALLALGLGLSAGGEVASAKDYTIDQYHVNVAIQTNGDAVVTQRVAYDFDGSFHGVYYNQDIGGIKGLVDPAVSVRTATGKTHQLAHNRSQQPNTFLTTKTKNNYKFKVFYPTRDDRVTFQYHYQLKGVVTNYKDTAELNWKIVGSAWEEDLDNVKITVQLPAKNIGRLQAWTHGPLDGDTTVNKKSGRVTMQVASVPAETFLESHMLFPTQVTAQNPNVKPQRRLKAAQEQEAQLVAEANRQREQSRRVPLVIAGIALAIGTLYLVIQWWWFRRHPVHTVKEVPPVHSFEIPPYPAATAQSILTRTTPDNAAFTAWLMELAAAGEITISPEKVGRHKTYRLTQTTKMSAANKTEDLLRFLFEKVGHQDAAGHQTVTLREINKYGNGASKKMSQKFTAWQEAELNRVKAQQFFDEANGQTQLQAWLLLIFNAILAGGGALCAAFVVWSNWRLVGFIWAAVLMAVTLGVAVKRLWHLSPYTQAGADAAGPIKGFKAMLQDIGHFDRAQVGDLILWERILPYAVAFGSAKQVIAAMQTDFSAEELATGMGFYYPLFFYGDFGNTTFASQFGHDFGGNIQSAMSSSSGGSGGFSGGSSGGFGGGSGGGAF